MKKFLIVMAVIVLLVSVIGIIGVREMHKETQTAVSETVAEMEMTVDEFVSLPGDFYFIVKDIDTLGVLEADVYMEREIVEVAVCDDTENTICLFIKLNENEKPHYRKVTE